MTKAETVAHLIKQHLQAADAELTYDAEADIIEVIVWARREPNRATVVEF